MSRPGRSTLPLLSVLLALFVAMSVVAAVRAQGFPGGPPAVTPVARLNTAQLIQGQQHVVAIALDIPDKFHSQSATPSNADFIATATTVEATAGVTLHPVVYPKGKDYDFPALGGKLNVYEGQVVIYVPLTVAGDAAVGSSITIRGKLTMQLCDDKMCFPPNEEAWEVTTTVAARGAQVAGAADPALFAAFDWSKFGETSAPATAPPATATKSKAVVEFFWLSFELSAWYVSFPLAIFVGVLFNVMPCVLPVLPLKALSFYEAGKHSRGKSLFLGLVFSAGMVALFAALGVLISAFGFTWGQQFQYGWFVWAMALVLVVMAAGMWGLFTINLPTAVYSVDPRQDTLTGNFLFGAFTAILATPCIAPMFAPLTIWAAAQPPLVGTLLFTAVGVGMALPYLLLSGFPEWAKRLPRTGPWSEAVKQLMGFLILATAVWLLGQRYMPGNSNLWAVAVVALAAGVFLIARTAQLMPRRRPIAIAALAAVCFTGLTFLVAAKANEKTVEWTPYSDKALADARQAGRTVLVKFTANWCANCQVVEHSVFPDKQVQAELRKLDVLLLKVDLTRPGAPGSDLLRQLNPAGGIPLTAIYTKGLPEPTQLSSIYTAGTLIEILARQK